MSYNDAANGEVAPMNDPLIEMLSCVTDDRREQAKRYSLANILLFCILGFLCGAKSYKALCSFMSEFDTLNRNVTCYQPLTGRQKVVGTTDARFSGFSP